MTITIDWAGATTYNSNVGSSDFTINKPTVATGETLCLFACTTDANPTVGWDAITGWTQHVNHFSSTSDIRLAIYTRKVDGTEGATFNAVTSVVQPSQRLIGHCFRVQGGNADAPMDIIGTDVAFAATSAHTIAAESTTQANCHAVSVLGFFGTDGSPVSTTGTGWTEQQEILGGNTAGNGGFTMLVLSDKAIPSAGTTGDNVHGTAVADRGVKMIFAFAPAAAEGAPPLIGSTGGIVIPRPRLRMVGY